MRVSEFYALGLEQPSLDFVDVDIRGDLRVFVDPRAIRLLATPWADECVSLIQDFFLCVLDAIKEGRNAEARALLRSLREPNEVHLGLSVGHARGRALGKESAHDVWTALRGSEAAASGLLEDLEDTILLVPGIGSDIVSDISINIIRDPLIRYTQEQCRYYGIPLTGSIDSGPLWDPGEHSWYNKYVALPRTSGGKLLLVPKAIVRRRLDYDVDEYYRHYILERLREQELAAGSELVKLLKSGKRIVLKKALVAKYGRGKPAVIKQTRLHPDLLEQYRHDKRTAPQPPMSHEDIADAEGSEHVKWAHLLENVTKLTPGKDDADAYSKNVEALLTALLYPVLTHPQREHQIHEGRKRIDITYTNLATSGFFQWLGAHHPCSRIFVECKNYVADPANPELDQLAGRFSPLRGKVGLLVCRRIADKELLLRRCRDTAVDDRGLIIPLDDSDLAELVRARREDPETHNVDFSLLRERFDRLIL